jgi:hypothetical protein
MRKGMPLASECVTVGVNTDCGICIESPVAEHLVEQNPRGCIVRRNDFGRDERDIDAKMRKRLYQCLSADVTPATVLNVLWNCGYELKMAHVSMQSRREDDPVPCVGSPDCSG